MLTRFLNMVIHTALCASVGLGCRAESAVTDGGRADSASDSDRAGSRADSAWSSDAPDKAACDDLSWRAATLIVSAASGVTQMLWGLGLPAHECVAQLRGLLRC